MSYHRKPMGEVDCEATPDDEVCKAFYAKPAVQPPAESGSLFTGFADFIKKGIETLKGSGTVDAVNAAAVASQAQAKASATTSKSSLIPIVLVGGGAVALWMYLRKK